MSVTAWWAGKRAPFLHATTECRPRIHPMASGGRKRRLYVRSSEAAPLGVIAKAWLGR